MRRKSNVQIVKSIMEYSQYGALAQAFVIDALTKYSEAVSKSDPKIYENSLVNGNSWIGVAKEIQDKLKTEYGY